jgi:hypothetical protein
MAKAYIVPSTYFGSTPPTGSNNIAESNLILVAAQGGTNNIFFALTPRTTDFFSNEPTV